MKNKFFKIIQITIVFSLLIQCVIKNKNYNKMQKETSDIKTEINKDIPIIDRELFFGNPQISSGQISPNGKWITFQKEYKGIMNLWIKKFDEPFDQARRLTNVNRPISGYFWTFDSQNILYINDNKGDENYHIFLVDPINLDFDENNNQKSYDLTDFEKVNAQIYNVSRKNPNELFVGLNNRDESWHDLYKLDLKTRKLTLLYKNEKRVVNWSFDWDEKLRLVYTNDEITGNNLINKVDENFNFVKIYETNTKENAYIYAFNEDNNSVYLVSNKGDVNLSTLYLLNLETLEINKLESDPENKVDFGYMMIDNNTRKIIYTSYENDKEKKYFQNKDWEEDFNFLKHNFPNVEFGISSSSLDYNKLLVYTTSDTKTTRVYYFNRETKELIHQYTPMPAMEEYEQFLSPMKSIVYKSSDGLEIPAYLTLPMNKTPKNLPLIVFVHGGPKGPRDSWGYNSRVQILANRGYAVLQPNFRASGGYGKDFLNAGDLQWGKLMQDDITFGVKYLIDSGIVNDKKVAILGGSYGGYATLAGLAFTPDLYVCGVDIVGPSNLFTLINSIPPYWESGRKYFYEMIGDPNTEEGKKQLTETSPLFYSDNIKKPLLVIQGAYDPRVKQAESDQIVSKLRDKGQEVYYILADDEGHGFHKPINNMAMWVEIERFLAKYLDGKIQEEINLEVAKRLEEITIDINTVKYENKTER